jgi:poly(beta-D-mannuronate) lyase
VLGTPYDLRIVAAAGRIDVFYNGAHSGGAALAGDDWYFKTGSYLQSNVSRGDAADAVGQVVLYALRVSHAG